MAEGTIAKDSRVKFLLGTQANLEDYLVGGNGSKTAENGAFYLTSDTHRLYVGTSSGRVVPVNEGVVTVATLSDLPKTNVHAGEFYYVTGSNILCVYSGNEIGWVQINSNTDTYYTDANTTIDLDGNVATITKTFTKNNNTEASDLTDSWYLEVADGVAMTVDKATDKIKLTGAKIDGFTTAASDNVATVTLKDSFNNTASFNLKSKTSKYAPITRDDDGNIVIDVQKQTNDSVAIRNGHVSGGTSSNEGFTVAVSDKDGEVSGSFNPGIKVGEGETEVKFVNGAAVLPVYTMDEVDAMKLALNAMTYKGLVATTASSGVLAWSSVRSSNEVSVGDTYLFAEDVTFVDSGTNKEITLTKGTLAIARGTESATTGFITGTIKWDYVESTKDTDTHYKLNGISNGIQLVSVIGGAEKDALQKLVFDNGTEITPSVSTANGTTTVKFNHEAHSFTPGTSEALAQGAAAYSATSGKAEKTNSLTVVDNMTVNAQGHVTAFSTKEVTLKDTNATIESIGVSVNSASTTDGTSTASMKSYASLLGGNGISMGEKSSNWSLVSKSLQFTKDKASGNLNIDLMWGSF